MSTSFTYHCSDCGKLFPAGGIVYLCPECSAKQQPQQPPKGVMNISYPFEALAGITFEQLEKTQFIDLLPIEHSANLPFLKVGKTPLYNISRPDEEEIDHGLYLKDDSQNPTFSFKDRASALVSAFAKENDINTIVAASTGNAGSSLAGMCAAQGQKAIIFVPAKAPKAKLTQILMYGAVLVPVNGNYDMAFDLSIEASHRFGWYNRNTSYNPLTIEGKKTVSFELFSQLNKHLPDRIFVPVGDGVIISGVYKGFEDLLNLRFINRIPTIVAVQAEGSSNLIDNLGNDRFTMKSAKTIADSISVDIPRNFRMAAQYLSNYNGEVMRVSDQEILSASAQLSRTTGIFTEPAAAAAFAGYLKAKSDRQLTQGSENVVLLTGSGLKDLNAVQSLLSIPEAVSPDIESIEKFLNGKV